MYLFLARQARLQTGPQPAIALPSEAGENIRETLEAITMTDGMKILIAYDGSRSAQAALDDLGRAGFPETNVSAEILTVAEVWLPPMEGEESRNRQFVTTGLREKFEENLEILDKAGTTAAEGAERVRNLFPDWKTGAKASYGSPAWEILSRAEETGSDLIVVGAKGCSAIDRVLIGSVSQKIVTEAQCPVRVARGRVVVDESPIRLVVGYDGTEGAREAVRTVAGREWPANTEARVVIVEDSMFVRSSLEIDVAEIKQVGEELTADLSRIGLNAELAVLEGNPKTEIISASDEWDADCIFIGATRYNDLITRYLLGSVSSAVVSRAHCSVEVVRPKGYSGEEE